MGLGSLEASSGQKAGVWVCLRGWPRRSGKGGGTREAAGLAYFLSLTPVDRCQPLRVVISLPAEAAFFQGILWEQGVMQTRRTTQGCLSLHSEFKTTWGTSGEDEQFMGPKKGFLPASSGLGYAQSSISPGFSEAHTRLTFCLKVFL